MMSKGKPFNTSSSVPSSREEEFNTSVIITFEMIIDEKMKEGKKGFKTFFISSNRLTFETSFKDCFSIKYTFT